MKRLFKILLPICLVLGLALILIVATNGGASSLFRFAGKSASQIPNESDAVVAQINSVEIHKSEVEIMMQNMNTNPNAKITEAMAKERLIEYEILYQEAQKQGIALTPQEGTEYFLSQRKVIENASVDSSLSEEERQNALDVVAIQDEYIRGLGMSVDEYANYIGKTVARGISANKVLEQHVSANAQNAKTSDGSMDMDALRKSVVQALIDDNGYQVERSK